MRLTLVTTDYPPDKGGLEAYSHRIATALPGSLLAYALVGSGRPRGELPAPAAPCILLPRRGRGRWKALVWSAASILSLRARGRTDGALHMQWSTALGSYVLNRIGIRFPFVILVHGAEILDPGRPWLHAVKGRIFAQAYAVVAGSLATAELFRQLKLPFRRLEVIPYGNPLESAFPPPVRAPIGKGPGPHALRLLCMHRLVPRKGTRLLIEALSTLREWPWSLKIVGEGEEAEPLQARVRSLGLADRITFAPPVAEGDKVDLFRSADLFILPSLAPLGNNHMEGLGLTLLEAQSQELPVLAARTGGIPEAVDDGVTGLLFHPGDQGDLADKLSGLLGNPARLQELGQAGPLWVKRKFDWTRSLARLSDLLKEMPC